MLLEELWHSSNAKATRSCRMSVLMPRRNVVSTRTESSVAIRRDVLLCVLLSSSMNSMPQS